MLGRKFSPALVLMGTSLVTVQALQLTSTCSATLQGLFTAPDVGCLNLPSLLSFVINPNKSVPQTVNLWLTGLCNVGSCSNETIATVVANVTHGCSEDFSNANIDILGIQDKVTNIAQKVYPTVRKVGCLKDTTTNELCVTQTLNNLESVIGKLGPEDLDIDTLSQDIQTLLASNLTKVACTDCTGSAYTIGRSDFPDQVSHIDQPSEHLCGASFLDGNVPSNIVATANNDTFTARVLNTNSSNLLVPSKWSISAWSLLVLSIAFTFLA